MYQRILLAYDGSESGQKALLDCRDIAQWSQSELYLIAVMPSPAVYIAVDGGFYDSGRDEEDKQRFKAILEDGLRRLKDAGIELAVITDELSRGNIVNLGEFGSFWLRIETEGADTAEEVTSKNITNVLPRFTPGKAFKEALDKITFEKG